MKIYDQHVHTELSFDSKEKFTNYLDKCQEMGITTFVSTEHLDLDSRPINKDIIPDFQRQRAVIEACKKEYNINILMGIEVGYKPSIKKRNEEILQANNFDVVLLSVHESEETDVNTPRFLEGRTAEEIYKEYLDLCIIAVNEFDDFDIFTHVDYMLRYTDKVEIEQFQDQIDELCQCIIKKDKSLEFNTRFIYGYQDASYSRYIFERYYAQGGRRISLGSDSHAVEFYQGGFDVAIDILKEIGYTSISVYEQRKATEIPIL